MKYIVRVFLLLLICTSTAWAVDKGQQQAFLLAKSLFDKNEQLDQAIHDLRLVLPQIKEDADLHVAGIIFEGAVQQASMAMKNHDSWLATYSAMQNKTDKQFVLEELRYSQKVALNAIERSVSQINKALSSINDHALSTQLVKLRDVLNEENQLLSSWKP
jgi:alpha-D-ribose 1-methylphosphonate 5-triphosphate synthase subunit PhnI